MAFTNIKSTQNVFLENYLRGTGRSLTSRDAAAKFGIQNLRARMTDFRDAGLVVRTDFASSGLTRYSVSRRSVTGSQAKTFS